MLIFKHLSAFKETGSSVALNTWMKYLATFQFATGLGQALSDGRFHSITTDFGEALEADGHL